MKFMHVADLHLDSPFAGINQDQAQLQDMLINAPYQAFEACVTFAIQEDLDFMLIVGDIYDADRQTIRAQHFFYEQVKRLDQAGIPVIACHGNHDYLRPGSRQLDYPKNVYMFLDQDLDYYDIELKSGEAVRFYGFSYNQRWIDDRKIEDFPVNPGVTDYTIGLLHGQFDGGGGAGNHYAPFNRQELLAKNYDYWALGHVHNSQLLNDEPLIIYPGTIQGRHINEAGDKGAYIISLEKQKPSRWEFVPMAQIVWDRIYLEASSQVQASDLVRQVQKLLLPYEEQGQESGQSYLLRLEIDHAQRLDQELLDQIQAGELLEALNLGRAQQAPFVLVNSLRLNRKFDLADLTYRGQLRTSFEATVDELRNGGIYDEVMADLFNHSVAKAWLSKLSRDEELRQSLIETAIQDVIQETGLIQAEEVGDED